MSYDLTGENWHLNEEDGKKFIKKALDFGINLFDTANMYSLGESEIVLGKAIKKIFKKRRGCNCYKNIFPDE